MFPIYEGKIFFLFEKPLHIFYHMQAKITAFLNMDLKDFRPAQANTIIHNQTNHRGY